MRYAARIATAAIVAVLCASCLRINVQGDPDTLLKRIASMQRLRVATYNTSLYEDTTAGVIHRLERGDPKARDIAAVLQRVRPDVVLLNEFDYDDGHRAADLFQRDYLEVAQPGGGAALLYPFRYLGPVNTGVPSGMDLDHDGKIGGQGRARGGDVWGYGLHPGQYGMLLLSKYPIDMGGVRSFQLLRWSAMPGARRPVDPVTGKPWYPDAVWNKLRLSSKSHWDVPVLTPLGPLHVLASHPTPPVFDGPEDRNGARNFDELRLWKEYLDNTGAGWLCDDRGRCGGLAPDARFVILGDLNADPLDGDGVPGAIGQLLRHPRVAPVPAPRSRGAVALAARHGLPRKGDTAEHTGDFGPESGTLRLDYLLPSRGLKVIHSEVLWPVPGELVPDPTKASDHRLVWADLRL